MATNPSGRRGSGKVQSFEVRLIEDPAVQEALNRKLRRPGEPSWVGRWLPTALLGAALLLAAFLGFLLRGLL